MRSKANGKVPAKKKLPATDAQLEEMVAEMLLAPLRRTAERKRLCTQTGASHEKIEKIIASSPVRDALGRGQAAYVQEKTAAILQKLFNAARAKEAWACKVVLELARVSEALSAIQTGADPSAEELAFTTAMEHSLVQNFLAALRGGNHVHDESDSAAQ